MKKIITSFLLVGFLFLPLDVWADSELTVDQAVTEILASQGVSQTDEIDCQEVTDRQLETLGDAVMSVMHPNEEEHRAMDNMMGGEGSQSLSLAHISMGRQYLGCFGENATVSSTMGGGMMGMMNMMGWGQGGWGSKSMMGGYFGLWSLLGVLTWVAFIVFLILGSIYFWGEIKRKRK